MRPTSCRTFCSTGSTPPRSRVWATRTRARTTTSWPNSLATPSSASSRERRHDRELFYQAELRAAAPAHGQWLRQLGFRVRGDRTQATQTPLRNRLAAALAPHGRDLRGERLRCFRDFRRLRAGHDRDVARHVLGVEDP